MVGTTRASPSDINTCCAVYLSTNLYVRIKSESRLEKINKKHAMIDAKSTLWGSGGRQGQTTKSNIVSWA
jgi:hypothetical protein